MCKEYDDDDDMILVIVKLIWSCEMRVTSECDIVIYDAKHCCAIYDAVWYMCSLSCVKNHQSEDLWSTTNKSILYVYLFLEELIVKFHVSAVGSSCTHLYMVEPTPNRVKETPNKVESSNEA